MGETITLSTTASPTNATQISPLGTELDFDGINDYVGTNISLSNLSKFTIEGKFYPKNLGNRIGLVGQNDIIEFGFSSATNIQAWTPGGGQIDWTFDGTTLPLNTWHHIALVGNGSSLKLYIDGILKSTGGSTTSSYGSSNYKVNIGGGGIFDDSGNNFNGKIDEIRIWGLASCYHVATFCICHCSTCVALDVRAVMT